MASLNALRLLRVWERGFGRNAWERAVEILAEADSDAPAEELAGLPIREVEERLLAIREATFGRRFCARISCPSCSESLEFEFSSDDLPDPERSKFHSALAPLKIGDFVLELRVPNSADLGFVARCSSVEEARQFLARRCINRVYLRGAVIAPEELPDSLISDIAQYFEASDPADEKTLKITCPSCEVLSERRFDIASFFWAEIEAEALRLFREIHCLARGYGWPEADILAMTPVRRRVYLEMLQG
jgi:hypothetical protein